MSPRQWVSATRRDFRQVLRVLPATPMEVHYGIDARARGGIWALRAPKSQFVRSNPRRLPTTIPLQADLFPLMRSKQALRS